MNVKKDDEFERKDLPDKLIAFHKKLEHLDHHLEHQLEAIEDHMKNMIGKLQKQEEGVEDRIKFSKTFFPELLCLSFGLVKDGSKIRPSCVMC